MQWEFVWFSEHLSASLIYRSGTHYWTLRPMALNNRGSCVLDQQY
jgi:hypothetical protein